MLAAGQQSGAKLTILLPSGTSKQVKLTSLKLNFLQVNLFSNTVVEGNKNVSLTLMLKFNFDIFNTSTLHLLTKYIMNHYLIIPRLPKKIKHRFKV